MGDRITCPHCGYVNEGDKKFISNLKFCMSCTEEMGGRQRRKKKPSDNEELPAETPREVDRILQGGTLRTRPRF